jgi:thiol:disulfide interchange protein
MKKTTLFFTLTVLVLSVCLAVSVKHKFFENSVVAAPPVATENEMATPIAEPKKDEAKPVEQQVVAEPKTYEEALTAAKAANKNLFLYFHTSRCIWCKKLENETLSDPIVKQALSSYLTYTVDTGNEGAVADKYRVVMVPTYLVVDPKTENVITRSSGFKRTGTFIDWLNKKDLR